MKSLIRYCDKCKEYTLKEICPQCSSKTRYPIPPRFSPEDRFSKYRRILKYHSDQ